MVRMDKLDIRTCPFARHTKGYTGVIFYKIRQQDGSFQDMTVKDTPSMRRFVEWVQIHD